MNKEAEQDEWVDEGLVGGEEEVHDLVGGGSGGVALVRWGGGSQGKAPPHFADVVREQLDQLLQGGPPVCVCVYVCVCVQVCEDKRRAMTTGMVVCHVLD